MINKYLIIFIVILLMPACAGMGEKRSDKSDEFLIEKKNPLVMPPDINDLPKPKQGVVEEKDDNDFENKLKTNTNKENNQKSNSSNTLQESIIKKIEE